jgi:cytochrome c
MLKLLSLASALLLSGMSLAGAQDAAAGEKGFAVCRACHQIGPNAKDAVGPVLNGVVGRKAGTYPGYNYSPANKNSGLTWDEATLAKYLENPQAVVKGTKMIFAGIHDPQKVKDVIAFLAQYNEDGTKKTQ